jgi:hypothetical protein
MFSKLAPAGSCFAIGVNNHRIRNHGCNLFFPPPLYDIIEMFSGERVFVATVAPGRSLLPTSFLLDKRRYADGGPPWDDFRHQ